MSLASHIEHGKRVGGPHYAVVGDPAAFYVWVNEDGHGEASQWIRGRQAFNEMHELHRLHSKDRAAFVAKVKALFLAHPKR